MGVFTGRYCEDRDFVSCGMATNKKSTTEGKGAGAGKVGEGGRRMALGKEAAAVERGAAAAAARKGAAAVERQLPKRYTGRVLVRLDPEAGMERVMRQAKAGGLNLGAVSMDGGRRLMGWMGSCLRS
jgi:hypothetical protein